MKSWSTLGVQGFELRGHLEGLFCTYCVSGAHTPSRWPLSSPPERRLRFSSIPYTPRVPWEFTGLGHFGPKWPKSAQKGGTPFFDEFFSKIPGSQTMLSPIFEKKSGEFPPAGPSALFPGFGKSRDIPGIFVFFRGGGPYNPL